MEEDNNNEAGYKKTTLEIHTHRQNDKEREYNVLQYI